MHPSSLFARNSSLATPDWSDPDTLKTLDLCLSCKACKRECPSNVDISRLKAEYLAQSYKASGRTPLKARVFGHVRRLNQMGAILPGVANFVNRLRPVRAILNRALNLAPQRSMPTFGKSLYGSYARHRGSARPSPLAPRPIVVLYADCFATYNEPHVGQAAVKVLEACGYEVRMPSVGCCGRAMMSTGLLKDACQSADDVLLRLKPFVEDDRVVAIVACEPSCVSAMTDDWLQLKLETPLSVRESAGEKGDARRTLRRGRTGTNTPRRPLGGRIRHPSSSTVTATKKRSGATRPAARC